MIEREVLWVSPPSLPGNIWGGLSQGMLQKRVPRVWQGLNKAGVRGEHLVGGRGVCQFQGTLGGYLILDWGLTHRH